MKCRIYTRRNHGNVHVYICDSFVGIGYVDPGVPAMEIVARGKPAAVQSGPGNRGD